METGERGQPVDQPARCRQAFAVKLVPDALALDV
jgi:hypothetical protein